MSHHPHGYHDYGPPGSGRPVMRDLALSGAAVNHSRPAVSENGTMTGQTTATMGGLYVVNPGVVPNPALVTSFVSPPPGGPSSVTAEANTPHIPEDRAPSMPPGGPIPVADGQRHPGVRPGTPHPCVRVPVVSTSASAAVQNRSSAQPATRLSAQAVPRRRRPEASPTPHRAWARGQMVNDPGPDNLIENMRDHNSRGVTSLDGGHASNNGSRPEGDRQAKDASSLQPQSSGGAGPSRLSRDVQRVNRTAADFDVVLREVRVQLQEAVRERNQLRQQLESLEEEKRSLQQELDNGRRSMSYNHGHAPVTQQAQGPAAPYCTVQGEAALQRAISGAQRSHLPGVSRLMLGGPYMLLVQSSTPGGVECDCIDFAATFGHLFKEIQDWAFSYANNARNAHHEVDSGLPNWFKAELACISDVGMWRQLLSASDTRWALIMKMIVHFLIQGVMSTELLHGFCAEWDQGILENTMSTSAQSNDLFFTTKAQLVGFLINQPTGMAHLGMKFRKIMGALRARIRYLMSPLAIQNDAYRSLEAIVNLAFRIGVTMNGCAAEWSISYPPCKAPFMSYDQVARDEFGHVIGAEQMNEHHRNYRVNLALTPTIIRRDLHHGTLMVTTVHVTDVLLTQ